MNYEYHHDGVQTRYTVNGQHYYKLEDVPEEHRAYFANIDKNRNGVPDNVEELWNSIQGPDGKTSFRKVIGALFKTMGDTIANDGNTRNIDFTEVKEVKEANQSKEAKEVNKESPRRTYDKQGRVVQQGESSFLPTLIKVMIGATIIVALLWYFGVIK